MSTEAQSSTITTGVPALAASEQHIRLIHKKRIQLANALVDAELQYLTAIRREYDAGTVTFTQLRYAYDLICAGQIPGRRERWMAALPISPEKVRTHAMREPTEVDGSWRGSSPLSPGEAYPLTGQSVVYVLFDINYVPIYVGSTSRFKNRVERHRKAGKIWHYWLAHPCRDRDHAYEAEASFLRQYMPSLNVQGPQTRTHSAGGSAV